MTTTRILGIAILIVSICTAIGCNKPTATTSSPTGTATIVAAPEILAKKYDAFHDVTLFLEQLSEDSAGNITLTASGLASGKPVKFGIKITNDWQTKEAHIGDSPLSMGVGNVSFIRTGPESDLFVQALAKIYGVQKVGSTMIDRISFAAVSLKGMPKDIMTNRVELKMFFENGKQDQYAEFFLNIDRKNNSIELAEKDEEYRPAIIRCLSK